MGKRTTMKADEKSLSVILGAGFSFGAGLPLTRDLFRSDGIPAFSSPTGEAQHRRVLDSYKEWEAQNPNQNAELWLAHIYSRHESERSVPWTWVLRFALSRLTPFVEGKEVLPYHYGICTSTDCEVHRKFWALIRSSGTLRSIVTTNYDLLVEQGFRENYSEHRSAPDCFYGGWPYNQSVRVMEDVYKRVARTVELGKVAPLYKLHGSLNWAKEHQLKIHNDVRAVFRTKESLGETLVVPPLPEKTRLPWLAPVWDLAERDLAASHTWLVCGYSLPEYDYAIREMFGRASRGSLTRIYMLDPNSTNLARWWKDALGFSGEIVALPGLPAALDSAELLMGVSHGT